MLLTPEEEAVALAAADKALEGLLAIFSDPDLPTPPSTLSTQTVDVPVEKSLAVDPIYR